MSLFSPSLLAEIARRRSAALEILGPEFISAAPPDQGLFAESQFIAGAARLVGEMELAAEFYGHASRFGTPSANASISADAAGIYHCRAAIAASLAGDGDRALALFTAALTNFASLQPEDYAIWKPGGRSPNTEYGDLMLYWAYAEARTGAWAEVEGRCAEALSSYRHGMKRRVFDDRKLPALAVALQQLAHFGAEPTEESRREVTRALTDVIRAANKQLRSTITSCTFVWDLEGAFLPEDPSIIPIFR